MQRKLDFDGQSKNLNRVKEKISDLILTFYETKRGKEFLNSELYEFVRWRTGDVSPDSPRRILSQLRAEGLLDYECIDRSMGLYRFKPLSEAA